MGVKDDVVLVDVLIQSIRSEDFGNLDKLVIIVMTMEEGFLAEYLRPCMRLDGHRSTHRGASHHRGEHAAITPHVQ